MLDPYDGKHAEDPSWSMTEEESDYIIRTLRQESAVKMRLVHPRTLQVTGRLGVILSSYPLPRSLDACADNKAQLDAVSIVLGCYYQRAAERDEKIEYDVSLTEHSDYYGVGEDVIEYLFGDDLEA